MNIRFARGVCLAVLLLAGFPACSKPLADDALIERTPELQRKLVAALAARGPNWHAHTGQLRPDGRPRYVNRLILEDSPYLLQHANNPVDWFPWGKEAFDKALREHKPIFLSIGYSTCHWCHVMEKESFDQLDIARKLNAGFVAIKVDREARPDLDHLYMTAVQLLTGQGGWPMNTLLTPEGKVFFGGTYFSHDELAQLLDKAQRVWHEQPGALNKQADQLMRQVAAAMQTETAAAALDPALAARTARLLLRGHDSLQGGFGTAPKFPNEPLLALWLDEAQRDADPALLAALETDLDAMAAGGIHDQVGGGFHRYSTDSEWLVPHFEKMLYNQAQLARLYIGAYRLTGKSDYARIARSTLDFALREMHTPAGGFTSALDADSGGGEGRYYLWTPAELRQTLDADNAAFAMRLYGVSESGNFEGVTILHLAHPVSTADRARLDRIDATLLAARSKRPYPHRDDKVLTGWNGLMITALAEAGDTLPDARYLDAAKRTADFLWTHQHRADGGVWRVSFDGKAGTPGMLEDYAWLARGYIALYDASGERVWLERAQALADAMQTRFAAHDGGAFVLAEADPLSPLAQTRDSADNALPSANGVAVAVLVELAKRTGEARYQDAAQAQLAALSGTITNDPSSHASLLIAADTLHRGETGSQQYAGRGAVAINARSVWTGPRSVVLESTLTIRPGWHINAHQPLQDYLIPTALQAADKGWKQVSVEYPEAKVVKLGFQKEALALYQKTVHLRMVLERAADAPQHTRVVLHLQACSDRVCLPPETLQLPVTAALVRNRTQP